MFKQDPPKIMRTPLDKNDHQELDDTELLTGKSIQHYLTIIRQLQWLVTLGRYDIDAQVCSNERAPRKAIEGLWICSEDQALFNQVQNSGT